MADIITEDEIIDKFNYWIGYFRGSSTALRSSGSIDPLALSADFESVCRDFSCIKNALEEIFFAEDDESEQEVETVDLSETELKPAEDNEQ